MLRVPQEALLGTLQRTLFWMNDALFGQLTMQTNGIVITHSHYPSIPMNIPNIPKEIHVNPNRSLQIMANQPDTLQKK
jgi:hypothetical protein